MYVFSENIRAAGLMVSSMLLYTLNDACLKAVGDTPVSYTHLTLPTKA